MVMYSSKLCLPPPLNLYSVARQNSVDCCQNYAAGLKCLGMLKGGEALDGSSNEHIVAVNNRNGREEVIDGHGWWCCTWR